MAGVAIVVGALIYASQPERGETLRAPSNELV